MVQRKRLTLDEKAFYDLLIKRTKHYNRHNHGHYNVDPDAGEVEVYFFDSPNAYGAEMWEEALVQVVIKSHAKNKGLDYNSDASISLTGTTTAAFRRLAAEWSGIIDTTNSDWQGDGFEGIYYWIVETEEYQEIEGKAKESATSDWWDDALRHTIFTDLPEEYRHDPDYIPNEDGKYGYSIDGIEWMESERYWHQSKDAHTFHVVMPAIYRAIKAGDLEITPEELEEFFWENQDWGDNVVERDHLTGNEYTRDYMLKDGDFWYYIPELLKRQAIQGYGAPLIQSIRLRIAENSLLYGLCMNMNFCVTERKSADRWHKFITYTVWCPAFKVRIVHNPTKEGVWAGAVSLRAGEYAVLDYAVFAEYSDVLVDNGWGRTRTGPMMEAFGGMRIIPETLLKRGLLDGEV